MFENKNTTKLIYIICALLAFLFVVVVAGYCGAFASTVIMAMPFTMVAWSESVPAATTAQKIAAVADEHVKVEGDNVIVPDLNYVAGILAVGLDIRNVQLSSPSLRRLALMDVSPVENTALPVFPPDPLVMGKSSMALEIDEHLAAYAGNSNVGAQQESVVLLLSDGNTEAINGKIITVKAAATAPATAYAWAGAPITLSQELPVGTYQLVGMRVEEAHTIAYRIVFIGGVNRPGGFAVAAISAKDPNGFRYGQLGAWGTFSHNKVPTIEFFGDGTGGAAVLYLDLIKID